MPISATSQYALKKLHQQEPSFVKTALTDVAAGDALALQALKEKTGIQSDVELKEAARLFLDHQMDALFAGANDPRLATTTGTDSASTFPANSGGVGGARMTAFVGLRGDASKQVLAGALKLLVDEKATLEGEKQTLVTERDTKQTELDGLKLNRRERFLGGFFAGVLGADSTKAEKGSALREQLETLNGQIEAKDAALTAIPERMRETTAKHLLQQGDPTIKGHDASLSKAREVLGVVDELRESISDAQSAVSSALAYEQQEKMREDRERNAGTANQPHSHGFDFTSMLSSSSVSSAESKLREVKSDAEDVEQALKQWGKDVDIGTIRTTDTGDSWDNFRDMMGHHGNGWFFDTGSTGVLMELSKASGELMSMDSRVDSVRRAVASRVDQLAGDRAAYLDTVQQQAMSP